MIELRHLKKAYPNATPLRDVNVTISDGDIISVIGPSGTGKSTLIRCINLLDQPTSGQVLLDGVDITDKKCDISQVRRKMGMVFQAFHLFDHLTVVENVMLAPVDLLKMGKQEAYDKAMQLLHMVGMEGRAMQYPYMLSGGQKQRVAIARTLAMDPDIILFDEPTSALDPTMIGEVETVIRELAKMGKTMMIVTHEMRFAREISNRVFYMDDGGIYEDGTPEQIFDHPRRERTRRFIRHLKIFETEIADRNFDFIETVASLDRYGFKNRIHPRTVYRLQSLFEELCQQILLPKLPQQPRIRFTVEYEKDSGTATAVILYNGGGFDPRNTPNLVSLAIVESISESMTYEPIQDEPFTDRFIVRVK